MFLQPKEVTFGASELLSWNRGLEGDQKIWSLNPYRVVPDVDK